MSPPEKGDIFFLQLALVFKLKSIVRGKENAEYLAIVVILLYSYYL